MDKTRQSGPKGCDVSVGRADILGIALNGDFNPVLLYWIFWQPSLRRDFRFLCSTEEIVLNILIYITVCCCRGTGTIL